MKELKHGTIVQVDDFNCNRCKGNIFYIKELSTYDFKTYTAYCQRCETCWGIRLENLNFKILGRETFEETWRVCLKNERK